MPISIKGKVSTKRKKILLWPKEVGEELKDIKNTRQYILDNKIVKDATEIFSERFSKNLLRKKSQVKDGFYYYLDRKSEKDFVKSVKGKIPRWFHGEEVDLFEDWEKQKLDTIAAAIKFPLGYFPLYHYEPRRWSKFDNANFVAKDENNLTEGYYDSPGNWDQPFAEIARPDQAGAFIGFKMYTALGYKPLDPKLKKTLTRFYEQCEKDSIPILCHCSETGMCTHDIKLYYDRDKSSKSAYYRRFRSGRKGDWYNDEFVSPLAWKRQVLKNYPKLKLCLAHFGGGSSGWNEWKNNTIDEIQKQQRNNKDSHIISTKIDETKIIADWFNKVDPENPNWIKQIVDMIEKDDGKKYPNFYTDLSFHFIKKQQREFLWLLEKHPLVKERIIFGTDWYMTELEKITISDFIGEAKPIFDVMSKKLEKRTGVHEDLWLTFTRINPMKFYGIRGIADKFAEGLKEALIMNKFLLKRDNNVKYIDNSILEKNLEIIKDSDFY